MRQFDCPQCGAPVAFQSNTAEAAVCEHCRSVVVRKDVNVHVIGQMAVLPPDTTPLQVGTSGSIAGLGFRLLGRVRVGWEGGSWNEWFIEYSDHTRGWLGEAQGFFMVLRETPVQHLSADPQQIRADQTLSINGQSFRVTDAKPVTCLGGEGDLPEPAVSGDKWQSIDLERPDGVASLEASGSEWRLFEGKNATFENLALQNLRAVPGWNGVPPLLENNQTRPLNCPACGGVVHLHAVGMTMTATCSHCGTLLDTSSPALSVVQDAAQARTVDPDVPLGARGKFNDIEWEMIGFMQRRNPDASWLEYLLFNPFHGFRWLTEFEGEWSLVDRLLEAPQNPQRFGGRSYELDADEPSEVTYVEGEFYWQVRRGEKSQVTDYSAPPYVLSREFYPELNETSWSAGASIPVQQVLGAFHLLQNPPPLAAASGTEINPYRERWQSLKVFALVALTALLVVQIFTSRSGGAPSYKNEFVYDKAAAATATSPTVTEPFEITKQGAVDIEVDAAVNNSWLGFDFELLNQQTGESYPTELSVEYYYGHDEDGDWKEGSQTASTSIPAVPPGTYTLAIESEADAAITQLPYTLRVSGGQTYFSNFFLCGIALLVWPLYTWIRYVGFEKRHRGPSFHLKH